MDEELTTRGRPVLGWILGIGLFAALLYLLHARLGWGPLLNPWLTLAPGEIIAALVLVFLSYGVRTLRVHQYFEPETSRAFPSTLRLVLLHNLLNNLLPMRTGEASFPILMRRSFGIPVLRSVSGLLYLRLLDLHFLLVLGAGALLAGAGLGGWAAILLLLPLPFLAFRLQEGLGDRMSDVPGRMGSWLRQGLAGLPTSASLFWRTWLWTGANWSVKLLVFAWILRAFRPMAYSAALLGSVTGELSSVLPIHGLAGAGTYEGGVMAGLLSLGLEAEPALRAAVNLHLFVLGASVLGGIFAFLLPSTPRKRPGEAPRG